MFFAKSSVRIRCRVPVLYAMSYVCLCGQLVLYSLPSHVPLFCAKLRALVFCQFMCLFSWLRHAPAPLYLAKSSARILCQIISPVLSQAICPGSLLRNVPVFFAMSCACVLCLLVFIQVLFLSCLPNHVPVVFDKSFADVLCQ